MVAPAVFLEVREGGELVPAAGLVVAAVAQVQALAAEAAAGEFGARAGRNLRSDVFRLLLALLVLAVGLRFAVELVVQPDDPFSLSVVERAK